MLRGHMTQIRGRMTRKKEVVEMLHGKEVKACLN